MQQSPLGSRNFIKYKNSCFMLKYNVLMIMKKLDSSVKHWNDKKRVLG
ncbi:hypothetical protein [Wolbachia endosymbiont (group A) of Gymnosoma rotundatum]|nr:hypothetical protein [Wolbachia endosymbiont (group A) of Gymnosoma rotundatum]